MITETSPIHINTLLMPEPQVGSQMDFDPARELTEEDWNHCLTSLQGVNVGVFISIYGALAAKASILWPEKRGKLPLEQLREYILAAQEMQKTDSAHAPSPLKPVYKKILFPNENLEEEPIEFDRWKNGIVKGIQDYNDPDTFLPFIDHALENVFTLYLLFPERREELLRTEGLRDVLEKRTQYNGDGVLEEHIAHVREDSILLRLLYGDSAVRFAPSELERVMKRLDEQRASLDDPRKGGIKSLVNQAFDLLLLSVDDIRLTPEGIQVVRQTNFHDVYPQVPQRKKF